MFDDAYEAEAWQEVLRWEDRTDSLTSTLVRAVGKPARVATGALFTLPLAGRAAERMADGMRAATRRFGERTDTTAVLARVSASAGREVTSLDDLRRLPLRDLDTAAAGLERRYIAAASASGGAAGALSALPGVGAPIALSALGADVVASTATLLAAVADYGAAYGRDVSRPEEAQFAVGLVSLGAVARDSQARQVVLTDLHAVSVLLAKGTTWSELSRHASVKALQAVFDKLGIRLTQRKLGQVLPYAGAAVGGTVGAALADHTCEAARQQYRRRYLLDKYPELAGG